VSIEAGVAARLSQAGEPGVIAVSLTFDDALVEHLDRAIPLLEEHGLRGTFYTHLTAPAMASRWSDWQAAASRGHELGNHTIFHPADGRKSWVRPGNAIDYYTLDRMRQELEAANRLLEALDGKTSRTFAYPCSQPVLGRPGAAHRLLRRCGLDRTRLTTWVDRCRLNWGSTEASYEPVVRELFPAARAGGLTFESQIPRVEDWNRWSLPSVAVEGWSLSQLQTYTEAGLSRETWVILQFHGIGGGHRMDCDVTVFRDFLAWLRLEHWPRVVTVHEGAGRMNAE
jgi:hypothetical protein